jgi:hypothetical protein
VRGTDALFVNIGAIRTGPGDLLAAARDVGLSKIVLLSSTTVRTRASRCTGVLVKGDLEGFFLMIMGSLTDTFLQDPLANKPVLEWFPSFGPMQFAVASAFGHAARWSHLTVGLAWTAAFTSAGLPGSVRSVAQGRNRT